MPASWPPCVHDTVASFGPDSRRTLPAAFTPPGHCRRGPRLRAMSLSGNDRWHYHVPHGARADRARRPDRGGRGENRREVRQDGSPGRARRPAANALCPWLARSPTRLPATGHRALAGRARQAGGGTREPDREAAATARTEPGKARCERGNASRDSRCAGRCHRQPHLEACRSGNPA